MTAPRRRAAPRKRSTHPAPPSSRILSTHVDSRLSADHLRHELEVHQEELRAQNEKLLAVLESLEEARDRYLELFEMAPTGYLTLDVHGVLREVNISGISLFGAERQELLDMPILRFIDADDRSRFLRYLNRCRHLERGPWPQMELTLRTRSGSRLVQITCRPRLEHGRPVFLFASVVDVTERRWLELDREALQRQHAELARQMMALQETERQRLARDIHDDLGQQVTALRLKLDWLASTVTDGDALRARVKVVQEVATSLDQRIDFLLKALRPPGLDDLGLVTALEHSVQEWGTTFGIHAQFVSSGLDGRRLPREAETHVFRIVQEALNNVHKHARATEVTVRVERRGGTTVVSIADDGMGLDGSERADHSARRGLGIVGMRERAALIGGELRITPIQTGGTLVTLTVP